MKMYDLLDAIRFMLPELTTTSAFSVFKQVFDNSDLTLACDLFIVKAFTPKLMKLVEVEAKQNSCLNLTYMGQRVETALLALADSLRVRCALCCLIPISNSSIHS
jgi:hypothetical protein